MLYIKTFERKEKLREHTKIPKYALSAKEYLKHNSECSIFFPGQKMEGNLLLLNHTYTPQTNITTTEHATLGTHVQVHVHTHTEFVIYFCQTLFV